MFGALSVFGRRIKGMIKLQHEQIKLQHEQVWTWNVTRHHYLLFPLAFVRGSVWKSGANLWCCAVSWAFLSL
jgi:hypothetical protein